MSEASACSLATFLLFLTGAIAECEFFSLSEQGWMRKPFPSGEEL